MLDSINDNKLFNRVIQKCNIINIQKCLLYNNDTQNIIDYFTENNKYNTKFILIDELKKKDIFNEIEYKSFNISNLSIKFDKNISNFMSTTNNFIKYNNSINRYIYNNDYLKYTANTQIMLLAKYNILKNIEILKNDPINVYQHTLLNILIFNDVHKKDKQRFESDLYLYSIFIFDDVIYQLNNYLNIDISLYIFNNFDIISEYNNKYINNNIYIDILNNITPLFNNYIYSEKNIFERMLFPQIGYINNKKYLIDFMSLICFNIIYNNDKNYNDYLTYNINQDNENDDILNNENNDILNKFNIFNIQINTITPKEIYPFIYIFKDTLSFYVKNNINNYIDSNDNYMLFYMVIIQNIFFTKNYKNVYIENLYKNFEFGIYNLEKLYLFLIEYYFDNNTTEHNIYKKDKKIYGCNPSLFVLSLYMLNNIIKKYNDKDSARFDKLLYYCALTFFKNNNISKDIDLLFY